MNRQNATALLVYIQKSSGVIPTTLAETSMMNGALATIEAVANGLVTIDVKPVGASVEPPPPPPKAPAPKKKAK